MLQVHADKVIELKALNVLSCDARLVIRTSGLKVAFYFIAGIKGW